jgi:hypothetical protein
MKGHNFQVSFRRRCGGEGSGNFGSTVARKSLQEIYLSLNDLSDIGLI